MKKIRLFLIELLSGKDISICMNIDVSKSKGLMPVSGYCKFVNVGIYGLDCGFTVPPDCVDLTKYDSFFKGRYRTHELVNKSVFKNGDELVCSCRNKFCYPYFGYILTYDRS